MDKLYIDGITVEVNRKKIKNMYLRVKDDGRVVVSAPVFLSDDSVRAFVVSRMDWIKNTVEDTDRGRVNQYSEGGKVGLFGREYPLKLNTDRRSGYYFEDGCLVLCVGKNSTVETRKKALAEVYRGAMEQILPEIVEKCQRDSGLYANEWRIKDMTTRWGSCNTKKKRIWLSLWLASKPLICLEATIYHELTHLKVKGHGRDFYALLGRICPNYKEADRILKG